MTPETMASIRNLPVDLVRRVEEFCTRFEEEWAAGERPAQEDFLVQAPSKRQPALDAGHGEWDNRSRSRGGNRRPEPAPTCGSVGRLSGGVHSMTKRSHLALPSLVLLEGKGDIQDT